MRRGYALTPQGEIHYAEAGAGEVVLLLHANPRSHRYFRHVLPLLGARYRAIAADIPGFGDSHPLPRPASIPGLAECLVNFLDALGLTRAHVVGLHTGNNIVPVYEAIFAFDLEEAMRRIRARTLVMELQTPEEAHLGTQADKVCALIPGAQALTLQGDGEAFETQPAALAQAILHFLG